MKFVGRFCTRYQNRKQLMYVWLNKTVNDSMDDSMSNSDEQFNKQFDKRFNAGFNERFDVRFDKWFDEWFNVWFDKYSSISINPILFRVSGVAYFIWEGRGWGAKCPTLVFSKLEMAWQWNLGHIEAILCQVKYNCEFSKWWIILDGVSTTLHNTVKYFHFWYILLTGVLQSSPNTYFQKIWSLLANATWK